MASMEKYLKLKFNRKAIICHRLEIAGGIFSDTKHSMPYDMMLLKQTG